jgi:hypothetical protein
MEIEFKEDKIIFDRELSLLDSFVLSFTEHLETNNIKYVIPLKNSYNSGLKWSKATNASIPVTLLRRIST